ncbi:ATP-binding protein [Desulfurococcaceae archaeon MEX13E-LK6-19]|nr:ATP-binding protein [Desulfurococcaceae archaeon MEX13E-LK6-19]
MKNIIYHFFNYSQGKYENAMADGVRQLLLVLIAGGPCTGKTTLVKGLSEELQKRGYSVYVIVDWAREIIREEKKKGDKGILPWTNRVLFEEKVVEKHLEEYVKLTKGLVKADIVLEDGGGFVAKAYCSVDNVPVPEIYNDLLKYKDLVDLVLLTTEAPFYTTDAERWEDKVYAKRIHDAIIKLHKELFRNKTVEIPYMDDVGKRVDRALKIVIEHYTRKNKQR